MKADSVFLLELASLMAHEGLPGKQPVLSSYCAGPGVLADDSVIKTGGPMGGGYEGSQPGVGRCWMARFAYQFSK